MATTVAAFLIAISSIYQQVYGGLRRELFSFAGPLYLPDDPMGTASYADVNYTSDIEIQFDLIQHDYWFEGGKQIFRLGKPDCCQWEYPLILQFGHDSWVGNSDQTGKLRAVWDMPGYDHGVPNADIPYNIIDSPRPYGTFMANWGVPYKIYYRFTPNYMYLQINDGIGNYSYTGNVTIDPPYDPSCCLDDTYQVYIGADSWRQAANVTISNVARCV